MFLHLSVILFTGGGLPQCMLGYHPLLRTRHPPVADTPPEQAPPAPGSRHPPVQCMLGDTANKRAVCILLECNLVLGDNFKISLKDEVIERFLKAVADLHVTILDELLRLSPIFFIFMQFPRKFEQIFNRLAPPGSPQFIADQECRLLLERNPEVVES